MPFLSTAELLLHSSIGFSVFLGVFSLLIRQI